jgi:hypothetical protein
MPSSSSTATRPAAGVTPSPVGSRLRDVMGAQPGGAGGSPPSFQDFTFTASNVLDGQVYRVSLSEDEGPRDLEAAGLGAAGGRKTGSSQGSSAVLDRSGDVSANEEVSGKLEGLRL